MAKKSLAAPIDNAFARLNDSYRLSETLLIPNLIAAAEVTAEHQQAIQDKTRLLIEAVRKKKLKAISVENFLQTYDLSSEEGLALMCMAEALLRIPDEQTQIELIRDKLGAVKWSENIGKVGNFTMNIATLGLATSDILLRWGLDSKGFVGALGSLSRKMSEPVIRQAVNQSMKLLGQQFVMGETIGDALKRAEIAEANGYRHSYDMLGEGAKTATDATRYYQAYHQAISEIAAHRRDGDIFQQPSISVKLSALHPRYELLQKDRVVAELYPRLLELCCHAKDHGIALTIDAEESDRLELSLEIIERLCQESTLTNWDGLGMAVQAYQRRAVIVIDWIIKIAQKYQRRLCVRLVKGAYWDSEIKKCQEKGLTDYPVFTRKVFTDLSYLVCARQMLRHAKEIYPQFATHNAYTASAIMAMAKEYDADFEFQRLHGMGEALYDQIVTSEIPCRVYAPVGEHCDLLAYLVRRLLENGANSSFVNKIYDTEVPIESLLVDPVAMAKGLTQLSHPAIPLPREMLLPTRLNSVGLDLSDQPLIAALEQHLKRVAQQSGVALKPTTLAKGDRNREVLTITQPANESAVVSTCTLADADDLMLALDQADEAFYSWTLRPVNERADLVEKLGNALEEQLFDYSALLVTEAGKTVGDAIAEIREAIDFCRYYANQARTKLMPLPLPGPTGERNELSLHGRGVFVCISPWNFPLAIFLGQVAAALVTGNTVIAKPAQQTPLVAAKICQLAHEIGIPREVLHFMPCKGSTIGTHLLTDHRVAGVAFTGSTEVAWSINQTLSQRHAAIVPLIAETGGINAMIVDSSALPEQVINDVVSSAFQSAGQRCSALRLLFVQEDVADRVLTMLAGAMQELKIASPSHLHSDIGPVIDKNAKAELIAYVDSLASYATLINITPAGNDNHLGHFIQPQAWELPSAELLTKEVFGPILHVVRYKADQLPEVIDHINKKGFGLTLGIHSRIERTIQYVRKHARVGNLYVNRNIIGAVVGVQPFGGEGLSGTGPKAGGPHYLYRFCVERTFTQDTTAAGGNASLLSALD